MASLLRRRPQEVIVAQISIHCHGPLLLQVIWLCSTVIMMLPPLSESPLPIRAHPKLWNDSRGPNGAGMSMNEHQSVWSFETSLSTDNWQRERMELCTSVVAATDAKNDESASDAACQIPKPPFLTGALSCSHCVSNICMFTIADKPPCSITLCSFRSGWSKQESSEENTLGKVYWKTIWEWLAFPVLVGDQCDWKQFGV